MDPTWYDLALIVGATCRLTRLAVVDDITAPARAAAVHTTRRISDRAGGWVESLLSCPHCAGFWVAAAVVASWVTVGHTAVWHAAALTLSVAYLAGHIVAAADRQG